MWFSQPVTHGSDVRVKPTRIESLLGERKSPHLVFSNPTSISVVLLNYMRNVKTEYSCRLKVRLHRTVCLSFSIHAFVWLVRVRFCSQKSIATNLLHTLHWNGSNYCRRPQRQYFIVWINFIFMTIRAWYMLLGDFRCNKINVLAVQIKPVRDAAPKTQSFYQESEYSVWRAIVCRVNGTPALLLLRPDKYPTEFHWSSCLTRLIEMQLKSVQQILKQSPNHNGPPSPLYNENRVIPGANAVGARRWPPTPI